MTALLHAELVKLRSLRTTWVLVGVVALIAATMPAVVVQISGTGEFPALTSDAMRELIVIQGELTLGAIFLLAVLASAGEIRHATITGSLLDTPDRARFVAAKFMTSALAGAVIALFATTASYAASTTMVVVNDVHVGLVSADVAVSVAGFTLAAALFGIVGTGLGLVVRSQTVAVAAAMMWWFVIEGALPVVTRQPDLADSLPVSVASALVHAGTPAGAGSTPTWTAAVILAGYAGVIAVVGAAVTTRRDVS